MLRRFGGGGHVVVPADLGECYHEFLGFPVVVVHVEGLYYVLRYGGYVVRSSVTVFLFVFFFVVVSNVSFSGMVV